MINVAVANCRILSICSGVGMLDEGVLLALPRARVVAYLERDAYAASVLMARMEDKAMEPAPIWCGNIEEFDGKPWVGAVDLVVSGFPCPPVSFAGHRRGIHDERWIFPEILRLIREVGAKWVFLENVEGLLSANAGREFGEVLRLLSESGFDAEWLTVRASDVGAPHRRERVFILAHANSTQCEGLSERPNRQSSGAIHKFSEPIFHTDPDDFLLAYPKSQRSREGWFHGERCEERSSSASHPLVEPIFPPGPDDLEEWGRILAEAPYKAPAVEPGFRLLVNGMALVVDQSRADQLRCTRNGVVALQAAIAFRVLAERIIGDRRRRFILGLESGVSAPSNL